MIVDETTNDCNCVQALKVVPPILVSEVSKTTMAWHVCADDFTLEKRLAIVARRTISLTLVISSC